MARNEVFQKLASEISNAVFATGITAVDEVQKQALPSGLTIGDHMKEVIAKLGENIVLSRCACVEAPENGLLCG